MVVRARAYLASEETKIIYDAAYFQKGHAQVDNIDLEFKHSLLEPKVTLHNIKIIDSTALNQQMDPALKIDEISANVNLWKLQSKKIKLDNIRIKGALVKVYRDENIEYNPGSIFRIQAPDSNKKKSDIEIDFRKLKLELIDLSLDYVDKIKGKDIKGTADSLLINMDIDEDTSATGYLDLDIGHLTFNTAKGGYLTGARVTGPIEMKYGQDLLEFLPTTLNISGDDYDAFAKIYFDQKTMTVLHIEKNDLIVDKTRVLLTRKIQEGIAPFGADGPIQAKANIEFYPGDKNPRAVVDLFMPNNVLHVGNLVFDQGFLRARFINRLNDDYADFFGEDKQNLRLFVDSLSAKFHDLNVHCTDGVIGFGPAVGTWAELDALIGGKASYVSDFLQAQDFRLSQGLFSSILNIHGDVNNLPEIIKAISGQVLFSDIELHYNPENILIPINRIELDKKKNLAEFDLRTSKTMYGNDLDISGQVTYINDVLSGKMDGKTHAKASLNAQEISWDGFTRLLLPVTQIGGGNEEKPAPNTTQNIGALKNLLSTLYDQFHPSIDMDIGRFIYRPDMVIDNFKTNLSFGNRSTVLLNNASFNFDDARVRTDVTLDINKKNKTYFDIALLTSNVNTRKIVDIFRLDSLPILENTEYLPNRFDLNLDVRGSIVDAQGVVPSSLLGSISILADPDHPFELGLDFETDNANAENPQLKTTVFIKGEPEFVNPYLNATNVNFDGGLYKLAFEYNDQVTTLQDAVEKTKLNFDINHTILRYLPTGMTIPIQYFTLATKENAGTFDLMLYADSFDQRLNLEGNLQDMTALLYGQTGDSNNINTDINAYSPRMDWSAYEYLFTGLKNPNKEQTSEENTNSFAAVKTGIYNGFKSLKPNIDLTVDTFNLDRDLVLHNILADLYMSKDSIVHLRNGHFDLDSGSFDFSASVNLYEEMRTPFTASFKTTKFDVAQLLQDINYLSIEALQAIDSLGGIIDLDLTLSSEYDEDIADINQDSTEAIIRFKLYNLAAKGISLIDTLIKNEKWRNRLRNIYIDSISNTIMLRNKEIKINLMEVQANAFQFFIEGAVSPSKRRNIWVTIPLSNLKKHDPNKIPERTGYARSGPKVFVELIPTGSGIDTKFHLSKRKFFANFDEDMTYREYRKKQRAIRRRYRHESAEK